MKRLLENAYDIPFHVKRGIEEYTISPENELDELFSISIQSHSGVRIVVEIEPQRHSADMLRDIEKADVEKQTLFKSYVERFKTLGAAVSIKVNGIETDLEPWPSSWKNFHIRINKIEPDMDFEEMAKDWALLATGMMLSLLNVIPLLEGKEEGAKKKVTVNKYERSKVNRTLCLSVHGYSCKICDMTFESVYGDLGKEFIHVHHIEPVSMMGGSYVLDPVKDLIPVCPNCHAMLHRSTPPMDPGVLRKIVMEIRDEE